MSSRGQSSTCSNCKHMTGAYSLPRSTCRRGPATPSGRSKWLILGTDVVVLDYPMDDTTDYNQVFSWQRKHFRAVDVENEGG